LLYSGHCFLPHRVDGHVGPAVLSILSNTRNVPQNSELPGMLRGPPLQMMMLVPLVTTFGLLAARTITPHAALDSSS
jgi:hypothetical protein